MAMKCVSFHATELVNGNDVWVVERGRGTSFRLKARQGFGLRMMLQRNRLDCDFTAEACVAGAINLAHTASPESLKDFVRAEARTRRQRGGN